MSIVHRFCSYTTTSFLCVVALGSQTQAATTFPLQVPSEQAQTALKLKPKSQKQQALQDRFKSTVIVQQVDTSETSVTDIVQRLEQRLVDLETRQRELLDEIDALKFQLQGQSSLPLVDIAADKQVEQSIELTNSGREQGLYLSGEVLFLNPNLGDELDFAIADSGEALATSGSLEAVEYGSETDTRISVGYRQGALDGRLTWLSIENSNSESAIRPESGFLFSTLTHPAQNDSAETAEAEASLSHVTTDVELGYSIAANQSLDMRLFAGLRFADINQDFNVAYDGVDFTNANVDLEHSFAGFGPKVGADLNLRLGSGFSLFSRVAGSLMVGDSRTTYNETDNDGDSVIADIKHRDNDRIISMLEMALGIDWSKQVTDNIDFGLSLGYEYQNWFNAYDSIQFVDNASPGIFNSERENIGLQGIFFKSGVSLDF